MDMAWIERSLRDASMRDLARMIEGFLNTEIPQLLGPPQLKPGEQFHSDQTRTLCTVVGPITLCRQYYRGPQGGRYPLDEALGLQGQYTPAVSQLMCWAGAMDGSFELASETLRRFAGLDIPGRQVQRVIQARAKGADEWMRNRPNDKRSAPIEILTVEADMTGIPARPEDLEGIKGKQPDGSAKTRQIKIGCVFTQSNSSDAIPERDPFSSTYLTTFGNVTTFGSHLRDEALKRGWASAKKTVFIGDGAEWIWNMASNFFKDAVQIVDFYHACEHLHALCKILEPDEDTANTLFRKWRKRLKNNGRAKLMEEASKRVETLSQASAKEALGQIEYFQKNAARMNYRSFRRQGFFIGSGAVEGACRHVVAQRAKLSGMRWHTSGAENVLAFRSLIKSNLFDSYCSAQKRVA